MTANARLPGKVVLLRADARALPLPDSSVDLVVTSPPYWHMRQYEDGGQVYGGQIGLEVTPLDYIAALVDCTREWARVLKPTGSIFVNLGDKYSDRAEGPAAHRSGRADRAEVISRSPNTIGMAPRKSLLMLPERYRIAVLDELRLGVRQTIVWDKPNGMPESVDDRCRRTHEDWVHLFKRGDYYAAVDRIRHEHARSWQAGSNGGAARPNRGDDLNVGLPDAEPHPLGALPGSVWEVPTQQLRVPDHVAHSRCCAGTPRPRCTQALDHYAAFPMEWPARLIAGFCPSGICTVCGEPRRPASVRGQEPVGGSTNSGSARRQLVDEAARRFNGAGRPRTRRVAHVVGEVCGCTPYTDHPGAGSRDKRHLRRGSGKAGFHPDTGQGFPAIGPWREYHVDGWTPPPTRPAVVLDPFGGSGTTAMVAAAYGHVGVHVDRSADYTGVIARWRVEDPDEIARAFVAIDPGQRRRRRRVKVTDPGGTVPLFDLAPAADVGTPA